ncbi:hypothetical protein AB1A81_06425 [Bdellovibrio bacteriovorus]|nr:hypothetical protein [Bdellovibrio bacteriovorus]AHZ86612.1 hypothetical protein EP01_16970 [Bdellovibrio bacteriovorus]BEV67859.1 hypothetical protein Bb109J_c1279 [Bdellovibrio bacteriovorus]
MRQFLTALIIFALGLPAIAETRKTLRSDGVRGVCLGCEDRGDRSVDQIRALRTTVGGDQSYKDIYRYNYNKQKDRKVAEVCSNFATDSGYGPLGRHVMNILNEREYPNLFDGTPDLVSLCPAFPQLGPEEKKVVFVAIMNVMALGESTCGAGPHTARGPNGTAVGLLQLHRGKEGSYESDHRHGHGPEIGCKNGDGEKPESSLKCGLHLLDMQFAGKGELFSRSSHWEVLRPQGRKQKFKWTKKIVSGLSVCK